MILILFEVLIACCQPAVAFLGERYQESRVSVRRPENADSRLLSFGDRSDLHGQLLTPGTATRQGRPTLS